MIIATVRSPAPRRPANGWSPVYPVGQVMFSRSLVDFGVRRLHAAGHGPRCLRPRSPAATLARGLSQSISQTFSVLAFSLMPLAGAVAINFSAPLWTGLVAIVWLKERAGCPLGRCLIGFLGVLIVTNPGADSLTLGATFALLNAVMWGR